MDDANGQAIGEPSADHFAKMEDTDDDAMEDSTEDIAVQDSVLEMEPMTVNGKRARRASVQKVEGTPFGLRKCFAISLLGMVLAITFMVVVGVTMTRPNDSQHQPGSSSTDGRFSRAAVATDVGLCSDLGRDILKQGGSAVDAMVSSLLCVGVVNSQSSGLGGGMFLMVYDKSTGKAETLMAREKAPAAATADMYRNDPSEQIKGYKSIAVPGELYGIWEAHRKYGKLPWEDLFRPVVRLALEGFPMTAHQARSVQLKLSSISNITSLPQYARMVARYQNPDGSWKTTGDMVYAPILAKTLQAIAMHGPDELATGHSGKRILEEMKTYGGLITEADLRDYTADWMPASTFTLDQDKTLLTSPSPSGGPIVEFILNILSNVNTQLKTTDDKIQLLHKFVEASKFAFALRSYLGDVDTAKVQEVLNKLKSDTLARTLFSRIQDDRVTYTNSSEYDPLIGTSSQHGGTCHISVVDKDGNAASATTSVNYYFGSGMVSNSTGILWNNEMGDFDTPASQPTSSVNHIAPGKMPLSAMSPVIVLNENNDVELVSGSAGSRAIITTNAWITWMSTFTDDSLQEIIDEKRVHNQLQPNNVVSYEAGLHKDLINGLVNLGHVLVEKPMVSVVQAIRRAGSEWDAYSDPRKHGKAAGY